MTVQEVEPAVRPVPRRAVPPAVSTWAARLLPPALFLLATLYCYSGLVASPRQRMVGGADGTAYAWYFEWTRQSLLHGHNPFVSTALNAPTGVSLTWNTSLFLLAVLCLPLTVTLGAGTTVALLFVVAPFLSATSAYFVLRRISGHALGAAIGATLFGFGPYFVGHQGHLNLIFVPLVPPILLLSRNLVLTQTRSAVRVGALLGVVVGLQFLVSEELIVLTLVVALPALVFLMALNPHATRHRARHAAIGVGVAAAVALVLSAVPLAYQLFGPLALSKGVTSANASANVASLVRPSLLQHFASHADVSANLHYKANGAENTGYLGWPLIALCLVLAGYLVLRRERFGPWWLLTAASAVVVSFGSPILFGSDTVSKGPWAVLRRVPLLGGVKTVRLSLLTLLLVGLLIAWALSRMSRPLRLGAAVLAVVALVPLFPVTPYRTNPVVATPKFFSTSAVDAIPAGATTLVLPVATFPSVPAMTWQIAAHIRFEMVGGYSVFKDGDESTFFPALPRAWGEVSAVAKTGVPLTAAQVADGRRSLTQFGVRYIVVTRQLGHLDQVVAAVGQIAGCTPAPVADVYLCRVST